MKVRESISSMLMLTVGAVLAAFSLEEFLIPNNIFDGGVTGVGMILSHYLPLNLGLIVAAIDIPFLLFGLKRMGHKFLFSAGYAIVLFSLALALFKDMRQATDDTFLAVIYGGVFLGIGVGLVLRGGGCLDGTEIVAIIVNKKTQLSVGKVVFMINIVIYTIAGFKFGMDKGMYSLVTYFITSKIIDIIEMGFDDTKSVMIISSDGKKLADEIYRRLGRTVTFLQGEGFVSKDKKDILYCVITRAEIYEMKSIINASGDSTFSTISNVAEILGEHIKSNEKQ
jgi:uncharacterized membrane-anchored protein YitT (DUF2179 family)